MDNVWAAETDYPPSLADTLPEVQRLGLRELQPKSRDLALHGEGYVTPIRQAALR